MMELFKVGGPCPETNYLFMGELAHFSYNALDKLTRLTLD